MVPLTKGPSPFDDVIMTSVLLICCKQSKWFELKKHILLFVCNQYTALRFCKNELKNYTVVSSPVTKQTTRIMVGTIVGRFSTQGHTNEESAALCAIISILSQGRHTHELLGVSNHRHLHSLFSSLFGLRTKKLTKHRNTEPFYENLWPADSGYKNPMPLNRCHVVTSSFYE